jgi:hypothetical protein
MAEHHHALSALHMQVHTAMQQTHDHLEHYGQILGGEAGYATLRQSLHDVHHHLKEAHNELEKYSELHEHENHEAH